ncbi:uncharacterized protein LOC8075647 isoform X1 [Sorghum bicolor]|uniref:Uncharacterized protein n=1 Tax=Sorghum bicolor TaxID=4558 RepID=C5YL44_SORBI|nr:uncharacterized protein LOC8075647 isoform X1 [Sorghum bicolor]EES15019.2 hypothetical protein SORBI_3007G133700 [Sorghum bicolor]|eukprot:XP_002445527.2 uncharacterized protein LOC8075647 isoform X1 [Sorghum bicolor]
MRKAGAKEGSIGSKGAVDMNSSHVSTAITRRPSNLMIKFCACTGRLSSSSQHNLENTDISMTCKGCTGESTADRGGPLCSGKLKNMGLELPRPLDLEVRWKTGNRRQRATRRARTSFGEETSRDGFGSFYLFGRATNQEMSQDAAVSESEKLGVSILGRRFSDPMENVPIKKRRFHMDCSPSPPPTPLLVDPYEKILGSSSKAVRSYDKHCKLKMQGIEYKEENKGRFGADDFSGIDILASAACESEMDGEMFNGECSKLAHPPEERKLENTTGSSKLSLLHNMEDKLNIPGTSHCIYDRPLGPSNSAPDMKSLFVATPTISENLVESAYAPKVNCSSYSALNSANKTEIVSDAKSSSVAIANSSDNPEKTIGCSQDTVVQTNHGNASRDSRLHWDLNVAMEAWDTDCGDVDDPLVSTVIDHDDARNGMEKPGTSHHFESRDGSVADHSVDTIHMADALKHVSANTNDTRDCTADGLSHPSQNLQLLESGSVGNDAIAETMDLPDQQNSRFASVMDSHIRSDLEPHLIMEHFASAAIVGKIDGSHPQPVHSEGLCNIMSSMNVNVGSNSLQTSELGTTLKPLASRLVSEESTNHPTAVMDSHIRSDPEPALIMEHFASAANVEKIDGSCPQPVHSEGLSNMSSMNVHVGTNSLQTSELGTTLKPLASRLVSEESTNLPTVGTFHKKVTDFGWSDNKLEEASEQSISESKNQELLDVDSGTSKKGERDTDIFYANKRTKDAENLTHPEDNHGSSDCDMAHAHEEDGAVVMINSKDSLITCANSSTLETYHISDEAHQVPGPSSECHKPEFITDAGSIVDSKAADSYQNGCKNELGKVVSNVCLDQCYETDISHISKNLAGVEEVDVEEDDSQYEDGEFRESDDCYWVGDGYEEVKHANLHYQVSDYKNEEATPGLTPLHTDSVAKNVVIPVSSYNGTQSRKEDIAVSPVSSKRSWLTNCLDGGPIADGKAQSVHSRGDTKMYGSNTGRVAVRSATTVSQSERCNDALGDDMLNIRMKNTGWDMMPEDQKHSQHDARDVTDSSNRCVLSSDAARDDESLRKRGLSNRDLQRVERQKSFDKPQRNELSRSDDGYGSGSKSERTMDSHRSHGMYGTSRHVQTSGRGEWVENSKHPRSTRRKSPEYYNYDPPGPRNAAEAAVAKMESSGFVVAPDGTLVRAVDAANAGQMPRRMRNTLSSSGRLISGRGSPIDRDGACGMSRGPVHAREASPERHFGANSNRSRRYGPEMEKDHTTDGNLSSVRCLLSSRQQGTPTSRASLNLSRAHSRSPSGSRSRSPHDWAPRNRSKIMANVGSTLRRHSRSPPNHMAKGRIVRMASPQRQPGYDDRAMRYSPLSRNNTYSQHASTWVEGRNGSAVDISDDHNKRYSRRSPPLRITSRNDRFDVMDSQGRPRSGEFYRPTQGRLLYGYDRENKHDRNGEDEREYSDRYANHSVKPYDRSGAVKQFRNNTGDKFRTRISAPRSPELQRRVSPRRFDRSFER